MNMADMQETLLNIQKQIKESREESQKQYTDLANKIDTFGNRVTELERKMKNTENDAEIFYDQFDTMNGEINYLKQKQLALNVMIRGIPEREGETQTQLQELIEQLITTLKIADIGVINAVKRIGVKNPNYSRPILMENLTKEQKTKIITAKRQQKITASQLVINNTPIGDSNTNIYIDDHLTPYTYRLLKRCKAIKSETNTKYVWTSNGIVYMRLNDNTQAQMMRNDIDVDQYKSAHKKATRQKRKVELDSDSPTEMETESTAPRKKLTRSASLNERYMQARAKFIQNGAKKGNQPSPSSASTSTGANTRRGARGKAGNEEK